MAEWEKVRGADAAETKMQSLWDMLRMIILSLEGIWFFCSRIMSRNRTWSNMAHTVFRPRTSSSWHAGTRWPQASGAQNKAKCCPGEKHVAGILQPRSHRTSWTAGLPPTHHPDGFINQLFKRSTFSIWFRCCVLTYYQWHLLQTLVCRNTEFLCFLTVVWMHFSLFLIYDKVQESFMGPMDLVLGHLSLQVTMETAGAHRSAGSGMLHCHSRDLKVLCKAGWAAHPRASAASLWGKWVPGVLQGQVRSGCWEPLSHWTRRTLQRGEAFSACSGYTASSLKPRPLSCPFTPNLEAPKTPNLILVTEKLVSLSHNL